MNNFAKRTISGIGFAAIMLAAFLTNKFVFGAVMLFALIVMMHPTNKSKNFWTRYIPETPLKMILIASLENLVKK